MQIHQYFKSTVALILILSITSACSSQSAQQTENSDAQFSGPNAVKYEEAYRKAQSDTARKILADEKVSDAELAQAEQQYIDCMEDRGYAVHRANGTLAEEAPIDKADDFHADMEHCNASTSYRDIEYFHWLDSGSDTNTSEDKNAARILECLKRHDLVDRSMTVDDYKRIFNNQSEDTEIFGKYFDESNPDYDAGKSAEYWACQTNPDS